MLESSNFAGMPQLDYEAWTALVRAACGGEPGVLEPKAFAGWIRSLSVCGFAADETMIQCGASAANLGRDAYRIERTYRDVRRAGMEHYNALFQVKGRSALIQNDQAIELTVGDVALVDMTRPLTLSSYMSGQWLILYLPRRPLVSHLGVEPRGGLHGRGGTRAGRLLAQLVRDAIDDGSFTSASAEAYMHLAFYDLLGALFTQSDPMSASIHTDKLFACICGIIKDRFADPDLGPSEVAAEAGISLRYLQKLFTARGTTCSHFIRSVRLNHAARLLQRRALLDVRLPHSEIAYACGFRDYTYFARNFRRHFGYPPSAAAGGQNARCGGL